MRKMKKFDHDFTFFFSMLKLSMMTPMKRLRVKKAPTTIKQTKKRYAQIFASLYG